MKKRYIIFLLLFLGVVGVLVFPTVRPAIIVPGESLTPTVQLPVLGPYGLTNSMIGTFIAGLLLVVTAFLTNIMAGQSAAPIILAPIGLTIASSTGLDPRAVLMTIAVGCSLAFPTPIGHPVNIMVMGSGGYSFRDFVKVGGPLTILLVAVILLSLRYFWHV